MSGESSNTSTLAAGGGVSGSSADQIETFVVGAAVLASQRVEFLLYGLIAHVKDKIKNEDKVFQGLTPENFLRGDPAALRATLGQLVRAFGDILPLTTKELKQFVEDRNLIVHNYWRLTKSGIRDGAHLENPLGFVIRFLNQCARWEEILKGILAYLRLSSAGGDEQKAGITEEDRRCMDLYKATARGVEVPQDK